MVKSKTTSLKLEDILDVCTHNGRGATPTPVSVNPPLPLGVFFTTEGFFLPKLGFLGGVVWLPVDRMSCCTSLQSVKLE